MFRCSSWHAAKPQKHHDCGKNVRFNSLSNFFWHLVKGQCVQSNQGAVTCTGFTNTLDWENLGRYLSADSSGLKGDRLGLHTLVGPQILNLE